jgi:MFS family permease
VLSLIAIVFPIVMAVMPNLIALIILRGVFGLSVGFVSVVAPLYVSETCEPSMYFKTVLGLTDPAYLNTTADFHSCQGRRGLLGCVFQAGICLGILIAYIVGSLLQQPNMGWRITLGLAGVPGFLLMLFAIFIMRESEVWLERRRAAGTATLLPTTALLGSSDQPSGWSGLFSSFYAKSMITATALAVTLQLTGINAIVFYVPKLLQSAGFSADLAKNLPIAVGAVNLLSTFPSMVLADRLGRKPLLLTGLALMILSLVRFLHLYRDGRECCQLTLFNFVFVCRVQLLPSSSRLEESLHNQIPGDGSLLPAFSCSTLDLSFRLVRPQTLYPL